MKKRRKIRLRKPAPTKPSHPIGTKKGKKGYKRKNKHVEPWLMSVSNVIFKLEE